MFFKIEIDDFYLDEERDLKPALVDYIVSSVIMKIEKRIQDKIDRQITEAVSSLSENFIKKAIDDVIQKFVTENKIKRNGVEITFEDYLRKIFEDNTNWSATSKLRDISKRFGEELKSQYNAAFAMHIVNNMKEQGMLKDEVVNALLLNKPMEVK